MTMPRPLVSLIVLAFWWGSASVPPLRAAAPAAADADALHRPLDQVLDLYVRDGYVYYGAIKAESARLNQYIASLDGPLAGPASYDRWSREERAAFWVNAYNAFVLETVAAHYPIKGRAPEYPANSIRQIPGAFDGVKHRAAGRSVTLDDIERQILPEFRDPRLYIALGRGAVGSGRLRSEAFTSDRLEGQLKDVAKEFTTRAELLQLDRPANRLQVTPIVSWHEAEFVAAYAASVPGYVSNRSPVERAILGFIAPYLLPGEVEFLQKNEFHVVYRDFDWRLNDLSGRRP